MATVKRTIIFLVQDNWNNEDWKDSFAFGKNERAAREYYEKKIADPIWTAEGRRKWRLVRRITNDYVITAN